ncbi:MULTISPECIES: hypothetical protein [unclassified Lonepinella]|uniref:hypothetical protein n=1 Tax=unclassified Lonepinella TaxID=2642006 RepID=UPI003F6DC3D1
MLDFTYEGSQEFLVYCVDEFLDSFKGKDSFLLPSSGDRRGDSSPYPNTAFLSKKQNIKYDLRRFLNEIYISVDIFDPKELKKMPSSFWNLFFELESLGKVKFSPHCVSGKNEINQNSSKSAIYDVIREIVLMDEYNNYSVDFGLIEVIFDLNKSRDNLPNNIIESFRILHKINYQLYRRNYLSSRK